MPYSQTNYTRIGFDGKAVDYSPIDLFRYSAFTLRQLSALGDPAYFSTDNGKTLSPFPFFHWITDGKTFTSSNDPADWNNGGANDAGDSYGYGLLGKKGDISPTDLTLMQAIGWQLQTTANFNADTAITNYAVDNFIGPMLLSDLSANVAAKLDSLQAMSSAVSTIKLSDSGVLAITPTQSVADHDVLLKISTPYSLSITGTSGNDTNRRYGRNAIEENHVRADMREMREDCDAHR